MRDFFKKIITFSVLLLPLFFYSQKTLSGIVKDTDGSLIISASVTVEEPGKDVVIAYGITNAKGEYKVIFTSTEPSIDVKIKAFNHKTLVTKINNDNQTYNFTIETEATEIQEVKLKTKIITKRGDTISYDLKAFENKADRTLADVLKKIPGIEVNTDGSVLYQGTAINKFYVNGKDLMEGGYGTVNNSLPKDAVQKVEVMENHQPVKILQNKVPSEQAAINVKLKSKITMTGRGEVGSGFGDPWLWNVKLTPMFFGQKNQWVVNYKTNNTGESVEKEGNILAFGSSWEGRRINTTQNNWLNVDAASIPNLPEKRYLMNNVHYLSANLLTNPFKNKEWELKANVNYTNNIITRESYSDTHYFQIDNHIISNILNHLSTDKAKGEIVFTKNAEKGFFKNTTTFTQFWNVDKAVAYRSSSNTSIQGNETVESPTTSFQNSLSAIIPWKQKLVNVKSYINYQKDNQTLDITPKDYASVISNNITSYNVLQALKMNTFQAVHSVNISFTQKAWTFTPEIGLDHLTTQMTSNISTLKENPNDYTNNIKYINSRPYASLDINYKMNAWMLYLRAPVNFNSITSEDPIRNVIRSLSKTTFEPNLFAQYSFASFWKASMSGGINYTFGDISDIYAGYILSNPIYLSKTNSDNPVKEIKNKNIGGKIEYRNPLNNIFFNLGYRYSHSTKNLIASIQNQQDGSVITEYDILKNRNYSNNYFGEFGKYFPKFKTNSSISYNKIESVGLQKINDDLKDVTTNSQNIGFKFNNAYFSLLSLDYTLTYVWAKQKGFSSKEISNKGFNHNLNLFIYPIKNHTIGFNWDQINSSDINSTYRNAFYDISYQYTWAKKKIDFELKWLNVGNRKVFEMYSLDAASELYSKIQLRPRQVILTVKFNFK
ncbi:hypothetical protein [Chryseobacterium sp. ISL-6]|uniref:hypothetical protein n=1 Tax=Chryseobacterium sp. ISL-6 TaxID=2819143 RepID=UPI001BE601C9|nr:hypothetical protein [Chryseobacterium sp. ISL-6]MBT2621284.1 hypothetical protein [Chryseobacterium sp. ISL-6]